MLRSPLTSAWIIQLGYENLINQQFGKGSNIECNWRIMVLAPNLRIQFTLISEAI